MLGNFLLGRSCAKDRYLSTVLPIRLVRMFSGLKWGVDRSGNVRFAPADNGSLGSELFDVNVNTGRARPWDERRRQARAVFCCLSVRVSSYW